MNKPKRSELIEALKTERERINIILNQWNDRDSRDDQQMFLELMAGDLAELLNRLN